MAECEQRDQKPKKRRMKALMIIQEVETRLESDNLRKKSSKRMLKWFDSLGWMKMKKK